MNKDDFSKWISILQTLNEKQQQELRTRLKLISDQQINTPDDWLFDGLYDSLRKHGMAANRKILMQSKGYKVYRAHQPELQAELDNLLTGISMRHARMALARLSTCRPRVFAPLSNPLSIND